MRACGTEFYKDAPLLVIMAAGEMFCLDIFQFKKQG
jgi:hypothetical protein